MTILDASSLPDGTRFETPCCIIGAGPAGITVARVLDAAGVDHVLVESGGPEPGGEAQRLNGGERSGEPFRFDQVELGLDAVRMRGLGGTTGHWNGVCRPLEPIDLADRPEIQRPGWPLTAADLERWYAVAQETLELGPLEWDARRWAAARGVPLALDGPNVTTSLFRFSPPTRFGSRYGPQLADSTRSTVLLHATTTKLQATPDGRRVIGVDARTPDGSRGVSVQPEFVVLATGGIDVPRVLLLNRVANSSGLVGEGFMEHPHGRVGRIVLDVDERTRELHTLHTGDPAYSGALGWAAFSPAPELLVERRLLNASVAIELSDRQVPGITVATGIAELAGPDARLEPRAVTIRSEQRAVPGNRVVLGRERDALGQRVARVEWRLDDETRASMRAVAELVATELGRAGVGRLQIDAGVPVEIGCHHMGTARMSEDPARGVVDPDCRTHDVDNLYLAGSAVFPSSGWANPTLTIVALAHRLGEHLVRQLRAQ